MSKNILTRFKINGSMKPQQRENDTIQNQEEKTMKKVLATVLTGAMVMAMGGVVAQADE